MISNVMNFINTALVACSNWFVIIFNKSGVLPVFFAFMSISLAVRFLLGPVFGKSSAGSDRARRSGEDDDDG